MSTPASHTVTLDFRDGPRNVITVPADETVLAAAEDAGIGLPFGCRRGTCATCTARCHEGSLEYRRAPRALKDRHRADGYVLLCIAEPRSDCRLEVGAAVQSDLVTNPWK